MTKSPFVLVMVLLIISAASLYYIYTSYEAFRVEDCKGVTCGEGEFCQTNTCHPVYPPKKL